MSMQFKILTRPYGQECVWSSVEEGLPPLADSFVVTEGTDIEAHIAAAIARMTAPVETPVEIVEKPSILSWVEDDKEAMKWRVIDYMRAHPGVGHAAFMAGLSWSEQNLAGLLIYQYAVNARDQWGAPLADETLTSCWAVLSYLANTMTTEQIQEAL